MNFFLQKRLLNTILYSYNMEYFLLNTSYSNHHYFYRPARQSRAEGEGRHPWFTVFQSTGVDKIFVGKMHYEQDA